MVGEQYNILDVGGRQGQSNSKTDGIELSIWCCSSACGTAGAPLEGSTIPYSSSRDCLPRVLRPDRRICRHRNPPRGVVCLRKPRFYEGQLFAEVLRIK